MTRPHLLVVEDHPYNRDLIEQLLEDEYDLSFAYDGQAALDSVFNTQKRFDAILLDVSIPKIDGLEVARRIRASRFSTVPIIAVTAHAMQGDPERALTAGCDAHVSKPIDEEVLMAVLARLVPRDCRKA